MDASPILNGTTAISLSLAIIVVTAMVSIARSAGSISRDVAHNAARITEICEVIARLPADYVPRGEIAAELKAMNAELKSVNVELAALRSEVVRVRNTP